MSNNQRKRKSAWGNSSNDPEPEPEVILKKEEPKTTIVPENTTIQPVVSNTPNQPVTSTDTPSTQPKLQFTKRVAKKTFRTQAELKCDSEDEERNPSKC